MRLLCPRQVAEGTQSACNALDDKFHYHNNLLSHSAKTPTYAVVYKHGISAYTITNLRRNQSITMHTLEKLCTILECTPNDVVIFTED